MHSVPTAEFRELWNSCDEDVVPANQVRHGGQHARTSAIPDITFLIPFCQ